MKRLTSKKTWENASKDLANEMGYSHIWKRLAAIEDILGDEYDLTNLRELLEVCKGKTPDQVEGIFEEWSHYLKFSAEKNAIEGALNSIYQGGEVDYERLCELVEADRAGRCRIIPN